MKPTADSAPASEKKVWTPRERVLTTLNHQIPDRVPLAFGGSFYHLTDELFFNLLRYFDLEYHPEETLFRRNKGHVGNHNDDRILERLGTDTRYVWLGSTDINSPDFSNAPNDRDVEGEDLYGVGFRKTGLQVQVVPGRFPIKGGDVEDYDISQIENYQFPKARDIVRVDELVRRAKFLHEQTDYAVVARQPNTFGIFEQACHLMGHENFFMCMSLNKEAASLMVSRIADFFIELYGYYLEAAPYLDIIELPGDDYAGTGMSMVSPEHYYEFFIEHWKRVVGFIRSRAPHIKLTMHSDGKVNDFMQCYIDTGIDTFHCLETNVGNDIATIKKDYGDRLAFWGALDIKGPMQKGKPAIEKDIDEKMRILKPGGGWVLATENVSMVDIPPENLLYAFEYAKKVGAY